MGQGDSRGEALEVGAAPATYVVYLLSCRDGTYYCGITNDLERRLARHRAGRGSKYVRSRLPCSVAVFSRRLSKSDALRHERLIKRLSRREKVPAILAI